MSGGRVLIRTCDTLAEAHTLQAALEGSGIHVEIRNETLAPLAGGIPFDQVRPELWVAELDAERARTLLAQQGELDEDAADTVTCPSCGESTDGTGTPSDHRGHVGGLPSEYKVILCLLLGVTVILAFLLYRAGRLPEAGDITYGKWDASTGCYEQRWRANDLLAYRGCDPADTGTHRDLAYYNRDGVKLSTLNDPDANGIVERGRWYDRAGRLTVECRDADEDGFWEACTSYGRGTAKTEEFIDTDGDWITDRILGYGLAGNLARECHDRDADGLTEECTEYYPDGSRGVWKDSDRDGIFETREVFDRSHRLVLSEAHGMSGGFRRLDADGL